MKDDKTRDELSAYLDGEAARPEDVARLLQKDEDAARRYIEMAKLSAHLKGLRPPEVDPAFTTRVMAHVRDVPGPRRRSALRIALTAATAALVLVVAAGLVRHARLRDGATAGPAQWAELDSESLWQEIGHRLREDPSVIEQPFAYPGALVLSANGEADLDWLPALAAQDWFADLAGALDETQDLDALIGSLSETETTTLKRLLVEYAEKGWTT
ncbi:MAG: hypothetical protein JXR94_07380 [Candidatus Hydrogenedentes bacterium]|nr:hypothetical protein [Candidatus Hydrogenedentota bacterium]